MNWNILLLCCLVFFQIKCSENVFVTTPNNEVLLVGDHLTLNCSSNSISYLRWYKDCEFCSNDTTAADNAISHYHAYNEKNGTVTLVVSSVTMTEAGSYTCGGNIEGQGFRSQVIVLATHPKCSISSTNVSESDLVTLSCSIVYKGQWAPRMKWQTAEGLTLTSTFHSISFGSAIRLTYTASVMATTDMNGIQFKCTTYFDQSDSKLNLSTDAMCICSRKSPVPSSASNIPTYTYDWMSPALSVSGNKLSLVKSSAQLRVKRESLNTTTCSKTVYVGNQIILGQDGLRCIWFVSTPSSGEHFVSNLQVLMIDQAMLQHTGTYSCYVNGKLTLSCNVNVVYSWNLDDHNFCSAEQGQNFDCLTTPPKSVAVHSGQSIYGICKVTGNPVPFVGWMFCPNVCDNIYPSKFPLSDKCQTINNRNDTSSSYFMKSNVKQGDSGLYICSATYLDAAATFYNVCVSVASYKCSGTWVKWWHWYQAAVAIVTVDIIAAICFLVMVIVILVDNDTTITFCSRLLLIVMNHCVLLILAAMMIIGCAICLDRDSDSVAVQWETGVIVMFVLLCLFGILSALVTCLFKCKGKVHLIVVIVWDVITILVALATLIWTLVNMSHCRSTQTSGDSDKWSWEIFLIALAIAILIFVLLSVLWYTRRKKHCKCCNGTSRWDCHISLGNCFPCCTHNDRGRIRVKSASEIKGCVGCFCGCCKRKVGDDPELDSKTYKSELKKTHGECSKTSPKRKPTRASKSDCCGKRGYSDYHSSWFCCATSSCCKCKVNDDEEHISAADSEDEDKRKNAAHKHPLHQRKLKDTSDNCCRQFCCLPCCVCCCSRCKRCDGTGKKSEKKDYKKSATKNEKNKKEVDEPNNQKKEKQAKGKNNETIRAEKEKETGRGRGKEEKPATKSENSHDKHDDTDGEETSSGAANNKKHNERVNELATKIGNKTPREKPDKEQLMIAPMFGTFELQESSQQKVKRFLPPKRVEADSVADDDRSLTPVTPGRYTNRDKSVDSPKESPKKSKKPNKTKEKESKEGRKKDIEKESLGASTDL